MAAEIELEQLMHSKTSCNYASTINEQNDCSFTESFIINEHIERPSANKTQRKIYMVLVVSLLLSLVCGSLYGFGRYSRDLKDALGLTQFQIERFGILLDTGSYVGHPVTGLIYDRFGQRLSCILAAVIVFCAYGTIEMGILHHFKAVWIFGISFFFVGLGSGLGYIAGLGVTTKNFQSTHHFSLAVGIVASGYGFSSTIVGLSYHAIGLRHFFLLWAVLFAAVNIFGSYALVVPSKQEETIQGEANNHDESMKHNLLEEANGSNRKHEPNNEEEILTTSHETAETQLRKWDDWHSKDFWMLFVAFACCTGCGLFVINNVSTMVQSIKGQDSFAANLVILLSLSNCCGRILMGLIADIPHMSKLTLLGITSLIMAGALFVSALAQPNTAQLCLTLTVALVAASYGGIWVLLVGILSDWFGNYNFGKNYGLIAVGSALSGTFFNTASAWKYEQFTPENSEICVGTDCYKWSFLFTGSAAVLCCIIVSLLDQCHKQS